MFEWALINKLSDIQERAGNCKSLLFPCKTAPKSINSLIHADPYSGHDLITNGQYILIDCCISKPLRIFLLLNYGQYIDVLSSQSLMHKPELAHTALENVSKTFTYGLSVSVNLRLIKRIYSDLSFIISINRLEESNLEQYQEICAFNKNLENIISHFKIPLPKAHPNPNDELDENITPAKNTKFYFKILKSTKFNDILKFKMTTNLIILEQFLRYTSDILFDNKQDIIKQVYTRCDSLTSNQINIQGLFSIEQLKIIYNQRKNHKRLEWKYICNYISKSSLIF